MNMIMIKSNYEITIWGEKENIFEIDECIVQELQICAYEFDRISRMGSYLVKYKYLSPKEKNIIKNLADKWLKEKRLYEYKIKGK